MSRIISDFYKSQTSIIIRYGIIVAICIAAFCLTGIFTNEKTLVPGIIISAFIVLTFAYMLCEIFFITPHAFRKQLSALSKEETEKIAEEYPSAKTVDDRHFLTDCTVFYSYRRIILVRYADIKTMRLKQRNLFLTLSDGRTVLMQFAPNDNAGVIMAYLKGKNPGISADAEQ